MTSLPQPYVKGYSFTAFQQGQGDGSFPGTNLDGELSNIAGSISAIAAFLAGAFRSDGAPTNGSIGADALSSDVLVGLSPPTPWAAETAYVAGATVTFGFGLYYVPEDYTSSDVFTADLAVGFVVLIQNFASLGLLADGSVGTSTILDGAITAAKLAAFSVGNGALQPGSVTRDKVGPNFGIMPIGAETTFAGVSLPAGWLREAGQAVSRVTYAMLLAVLTQALTANVTAGSAVLTGVSVDVTADGVSKLTGSKIEGFGASAGATVTAVTANTITMSAVATGTAAGAAYSLFPFGNGDGATTFNLPDARDRVLVGRGDMGGVDAGRITQMAGLGTVAGEEKHTLTTAELANHGHAVTETPHTHGTTEAQHTHGYLRTDVGNGVSGTNYGAANQFASTTGGATTGLTVNTATTGITVGNAGGGGAHNNLQPSAVRDMIIFAGV